MVLGLLVVLAYWYHVQPMGGGHGYFEDWCGPDTSRQLMSEAIDRTGGPSFFVDSFMAPIGMPGPYMGWEMEVSWLGSYFWKWSRDFPFVWVHFGFSLILSYLGVGWILRKMGLSRPSAWGLATFVVVFHVPRHYKTWHHYAHLQQHWMYWSFFLDAWIWQRFWRERRWSWSLEAWRALCLLGMLTNVGTFWGPEILEWSLVRLCGLGLLGWRMRQGEKPLRIDGSWRQALPPIVLGVPLLALVLRFFIPLAEAAKASPQLEDSLAWMGHWPYLFRPLWLDRFVETIFGWTGLRIVSHAIDYPETVITPGWIYWIPCVAGLLAVKRAQGRWKGLTVALPFVILFVIAVLYFDQVPPMVAVPIQKFVPFMRFFRVATRWGLFFPEIMGVVIALAWPELTAWARGLFPLKTRKAKLWVGLTATALSFEVLCMALAPISTMPPLSPAAQSLLRSVKEAPGTTVLDLPFCLAGGNGVCTEEQCPNYPKSTVSGCLRGWHDKKVYGIYAPRLFPSQCEYYRQPPYISWFDAWKKQRCFTEAEWGAFCSYLDVHHELSAVLLYPDIWSGAGTPECLAEFERHLGSPLQQAEFAGGPQIGDQLPPMSRLLRYGTRCVGTRP